MEERAGTKLTTSIPSQVSTQIYILCRDRWEYLHESINSIVGQLGPKDELIISDNSVSDAIKNGISKHFPELGYVRRQPNLSAHEHFRKIIGEASAEFLVLFHDDDMLEVGYLTAMKRAMISDKDLAAVACNAFLVKGNARTVIDFMGNLEGESRITDIAQLLQPYFSIGSYRPAPFPGYLYRTAKIKGLFLDENHGGKYADVSFLAKILSRGPILWLFTPLMFYRLHDSNDSNSHSVGQSLSLLRYLISHHEISRKSELVLDYKFKYLLYWCLRGNRNFLWGVLSSRKKRVVVFFLLTYFAKLAWKNKVPWNKIYKKYIH